MFVVESEEPHRWRMRVYETYTGGGWVSDEQPTTEAGSAVPLHEFAETLKERENVEIDVRIYAKSNSLISVGEPLKASIPAKVEFSPKPTFKLYLGDSQTSYLPRVVEENRKDLVSWARWAKAAESAEKSAGDGGDQGVVPQSSIRLDPNTLGFRLAAPEEGSSAFKSVQRSVPYVFMERMEPGPNPPVALLGDRVLVPPRQYKSIGSISTATGPMLRAAAGAYPQWVTDRYLQLPNDFPESVKELARELTSGDDNSYDMSQSVRRYLLTLPYSLDVSIPPEGQDWVEFFLFVQRRGYCQNYATSMITMLRSLSVPARLVVGFAPQLDEDRGLWVAQAQQYHAWPEVYFPEYGWVEFEPTPARVQPGLVLLDQPAGGPIISATAGFDCPPEEEFLGICDDENPFDPSIVGVEEDFTGIGEDVPGPEPSSGFGFGGFLSSTWTLVALGVLLAVVVPGGTLSYMGRRFARLGYPTVAFASMCLMGRLAGVAHGPRETPSEYGCRLARSFPDHGEAIARITQGFVTVRYGPSKEADPLERTGIRSAWRSLRGALRTRALRRLVPLQRRPSTSSG